MSSVTAEKNEALRHSDLVSYWAAIRRNPCITVLSVLALSLSLGIAYHRNIQADSGVVGSTLIVDLGYSKYQGFVDPTNQNTNFLGIRFAQPPTGTLRWEEPQTPRVTPGVQQATSQPNRCYEAEGGNQASSQFLTQGGLPTVLLPPSKYRMVEERTDVPGFSEDCLFLNVYVPGPLDPTRELPVVVWIHYGGYISGSASGIEGTDIFDGNNLVSASRNRVVAVVLQYRLGVFGFLAGQKVKDGGSLNVGLLDQQFALKWVQQKIHLFGGDPTMVTIWGSSAGAGSVLQHVIANGGQTEPPLFRGAIASSPFLPSQYKFNDAIPEELFSEVVTRTNCSSTADTLECLRNVDVSILQTANTDVSSSALFGTLVFVPVVDGSFISARPVELLRSGKVNGEALMTVTNTLEGLMFVDLTTADTVQIPHYVSQLFPQFGPANIAAVVSHYKVFGTGIEQAIAIMGESIFTCPSYYLLRAFPGRSFKGEFAVPPAGHGDDVVFFLPSVHGGAIPGPFNNTEFAKAFSEAFLNFVLKLDPNVKDDAANITPYWKMWDGSVEMIFNRTETGVPDVHVNLSSQDLLDRCTFWESVAAVTPQ